MDWNTKWSRFLSEFNTTFNDHEDEFLKKIWPESREFRLLRVHGCIYKAVFDTDINYQTTIWNVEKIDFQIIDKDKLSIRVGFVKEKRIDSDGEINNLKVKANEIISSQYKGIGENPVNLILSCFYFEKHNYFRYWYQGKILYLYLFEMKLKKRKRN